MNMHKSLYGPRAICIAAVLVLLAIICVLGIISIFAPFGLCAKNIGVPLITERPSDALTAEVTQIASDGEHLYLLYQTYGTVQVYSLDGDYQYSITVYRHSNGRIQMVGYEGTLYILDRMDNLYIFRGRDLVQYMDREQSADLRKSMNFYYQDPNYEIYSSGVWYAGPDGEETCLISMPTWWILFQHNLLWRMGLLLILSLLFLCYPWGKRKT